MVEVASYRRTENPWAGNMGSAHAVSVTQWDRCKDFLKEVEERSDFMGDLPDPKRQQDNRCLARKSILLPQKTTSHYNKTKLKNAQES